MFCAEFDGEAFDIVGVVAPAGDGDLAEGLGGAELASCQWHGEMVAGDGVSVVSAGGEWRGLWWRRPDRMAMERCVSSRVRRSCRSNRSGCGL